ncbi:MAG: universal stress protein [Myxococcota bacterium]|nr:universal stress protein [Myxococcota bacterium]MEE2779057.1 universal stress protein [Myxococcota bacterium]
MNNIEISYKRILCPVDFSETSRKAFYRAVGYSLLFKAELVVLHISERNLVTGGYEEVADEAQDTARLEAGLVRRLDELQEDGKIQQDERDRITLEISGGKPWVKIVKYATDHDVDLIIMGTHGRNRLASMLIGSNAERVVRRASCNVLCVRPDGYEPQL